MIKHTITEVLVFCEYLFVVFACISILVVAIPLALLIDLINGKFKPKDLYLAVKSSIKDTIKEIKK